MLLETTLSKDGVGCWFCRTGGASAIVFTFVRVSWCRELANARSPPFFELCGSNKFRSVLWEVPFNPLPVARPDSLGLDADSSFRAASGAVMSAKLAKAQFSSIFERWSSFVFLEVHLMFLATTQVVARATSSGGRRRCNMKISFSMVESQKTAAAAGTKGTYGVTVNGRLTGPAVGKRVSGIIRPSCLTSNTK